MADRPYKKGTRKAITSVPLRSLPQVPALASYDDGCYLETDTLGSVASGQGVYHSNRKEVGAGSGWKYYQMGTHCTTAALQGISLSKQTHGFSWVNWL